MSAKMISTMDDPHIVGRVKKYLEENVDKTYLDIGLMVTSLRNSYPEYATRQQKKFRKVVETAYRIVSLSYGLDCQGSGNESDDDDVELMDDQAAGGKNLMKNIMSDLYNKKTPKDTKQSNAKSASGAEAIDISSDEDESSKKGNGPKKNTAENSTNIIPNADTNLPRDVTLTRINFSIASSSNSNKEPSVAQNSNNQKRHNSNHAETQPAKKFMSQQILQHLAHENLLQNIRNGVGGMASQQMKPQAPKKFKKTVMLYQSNTTFQHMGGLEKKLKELCEILMHFKVPDVYFELGIVPPRGILLHGPSGCGKTMLASAIAGQLNLNMINVPATELIAGVSGESEERIRDIFDQAKAAAPCVLFIDEIDAISSNRNQAQKDMERRVVSQLISSIDSLREDFNGNEVLFIGATSRPDALDPALRREGRFDYEVALTIPSRKERKEILRVICDGMRVDPKLDYDKIAELTPGYVAADLVALTARAASVAVKNKWSEHMRKLRGQRKITIVELDDDEIGTGENEAKSKDTKSEAQEKDEPKASSTTSGDADTKSEAQETDEPKASSTTSAEADKSKEIIEKTEPTESSTTENKEKATEINGNDTSSNTIEQMDVDSEAATESPQKKSMPTKDEKENGEPTLAEMINWLDSPPEDLDLNDFFITLEEFCEAVKKMQPSAKREGFITVPDVTWNDIGSLRDVRQELRLAILAPVKFPTKMARLGLDAPSGVLLCGPPGCGKTLIAKAIANEAGINFISVKGPEMMNMYVGESERAVRHCFQRARNSAPCVIFFDEFDSLCPKRASSTENSSGVRIVNQLLTEMDGIQERNGVYIVAATNRPDIIDPAILRPGRLDTILYVGMPEMNDRYEILCAATKNRTTPVLADDVDLKKIAQDTDNFSGADLAGLIRQAAMLALKDALNQEVDSENLCVTMSNFERALELVRPSISEQDRAIYEDLRRRYAAPRSAVLKNGHSEYKA